MKNPPIVMAKGTGWNNETWEIFKPALDAAAEQAEEGIRAQGVTYSEWKLGMVDRCVPARLKQFVGLSIDQSKFHLSVDKRISTPSRNSVARWACTVAHEAIHCARYEHELGSTLLRLAASEGLAYTAEEKFRYGGRRRHPRFLDYELDIDTRISGRVGAILEFGEATLEDEAWLYAQPFGELRNIDYFGFQHVQAQLRKGYKIGDLMRLPCEEVLGL